MILKQVDFLSPPITLYHDGFLSHKSIASGIIFIISLIIIFAFGLYYFLQLFQRGQPEAYFFNHFIEDAGVFPINSSSFFHFISLANFQENDQNLGFDFESFRLVGIDTYFSYYQSDKNLSNFDHWLYGLCNNETDTEGISDIITQEFFTKSACIRKYFDSSKQEYYETNDSNFRWPRMAHGTYNSNKEFYVVFMEKCEQTTLNLILGEGYQCKNLKEKEDYYFNHGAVHFYFIDHYVDVLNYKQPNRKYFYRIENKLEKDSYSLNHLNFNPSNIKTYNGLLFENLEEDLSYVYDRNDVITTSTDKHGPGGEMGPREKNKENENENIQNIDNEKENEKQEENNSDNIYMAYYLWLGNRLQDYVRSYKRIQDVLSDIGGISQVIFIVAGIINKFYNGYIILIDTKKLLSSHSINLQEFYKNENKKGNNDNELPNSASLPSLQNIDTNKSISFDKKRDSIYSNNNIQNKENKEILNNNSNNINNHAFIDEKNFKYEKSYINKDTIKDGDNINKNKEIISFWNYFLYKIRYRKNETLEKCENFRLKILSESYIINNHLIINKYLKDININRENYKIK